MTLLNENQINYVLSLLEAEGIDYDPLKEELLDHVCCMIEAEMRTGISFHQAVDNSFNSFQEKELKNLQKQSIHSFNHKKRIMKITSFFALGLLLSFSTFWFFFYEPPSINPLKGNYEITSGFGNRIHPINKKMKMHKGVDFKAPMGTPVVATSDGIVEKVAIQTSGYGKHIIIRHDDQYSTLYAQLSKVDVQEGAQVKKGQVIGAVGSSGLSTAPHLHYEVIKDGEHIDPEAFIRP